MAPRKRPRQKKRAPIPSGAGESIETTVNGGVRPGFFARDRYALLIIFGVAFGLRVLNLIQMKLYSPFYDMPSIDANLFDQMAMKIAGGDWLGDEVFYYNPFYTYFLGVIYAVFGHSYTLVKAIQVVLGSVSPVLVYFIAARVQGRKVAFIAGVITAAYGLFVFHDELLLVESLTMFLILLTTLVMLRLRERPTWVGFIGSGLIMGVAFVSRPTVLPLVGFVWLIFAFGKERWTFWVPRVAVFCFVAGLMVLPTAIRNYVVGNDLVLVSAHTGYNFYLGNNPEANGYLIMPSAAPRSATDNPTDQRDYFTKMAEADVGTELKPSEVSRYWTRKGLAFIADHPALWLEILGKKLVRIINEFEFSDNQNYYFALQYSFVLRLPLFGFGFVCPLSLLGLILSARKWRPLALLYLFVIGYGASLMVFFSGSRYRMLFVPFLIIFAAHALYWIYENLKARRFRPLVMGGALLVLFTYLAFLDVPGISKDPHFVDYYNLGNKYLHKNRFDKAVEAFEQSIALRPNYLSSHNNLASAYEHNGEPDKALKEWKKLRALAKRKKSRVHLERAVRHIEALEAKRRE